MANRREGASEFLGEDPDGGGQASSLVLLPFLALAALLGFLYVEQAVLKVPVPQYPLARAEIAGAAVRLYWNPVAGEGVTYDVQVARDGARFADLLYEATDVEESRSDRIVTGRGSTFYWRVRARSDGRTHRWSAAVPFRMK